jgi:hypothetical protein
MVVSNMQSWAAQTARVLAPFDFDSGAAKRWGLCAAILPESGLAKMSVDESCEPADGLTGQVAFWRRPSANALVTEFATFPESLPRKAELGLSPLNRQSVTSNLIAVLAFAIAISAPIFPLKTQFLTDKPARAA